MFVVEADTAEEMRTEVVAYLRRMENTAKSEIEFWPKQRDKADANARMKVYSVAAKFFEDLVIKPKKDSNDQNNLP